MHWVTIVQNLRVCTTYCSAEPSCLWIYFSAEPYGLYLSSHFLHRTFWSIVDWHLQHRTFWSVIFNSEFYGTEPSGLCCVTNSTVQNLLVCALPLRLLQWRTFWLALFAIDCVICIEIKLSGNHPSFWVKSGVGDLPNHYKSLAYFKQIAITIQRSVLQKPISKVLWHRSFLPLRG